MKIYIFWALVVLSSLILPPLTSADCLSNEQEDALIAMATASNQSPSLFIDIFNNMCDRSYAKNETDSLFNNFEDELNVTNRLDYFDDNMEIYVDNKINNYTNWVEDQLDVKSYLADMVTIINASTNINSFDDKMSQASQRFEDQVDDQLSRFKDEYATKNYVDSQVNMKYNAITDNQQSLTGWEVPAMFMVVILVALFLFKDQIKQRFPIGMGIAPSNRSSYKAHSFGIPGMQALKTEVIHNDKGRTPSTDYSESKRKGKANG